MKVLLVADSENIRLLIRTYLEPRGFDMIHYSNPIKAMDNLEEIRPELVIFNAEDFPRHWKPFVRFLRNILNKEESVIILLRGEYFPFEEAAKASHLGVNGLLPEEFGNKEDLRHFDDILARYSLGNELRRDYRYVPGPNDELEFVFTHPDDLTLVTGSISNISLSSVSFEPDSPQITVKILNGTDVPYCSLRIGGMIVTFSSRIIRNKENLIFSLSDLSSDQKKSLQEYMAGRADRDLDAILHTTKGA